MKQIAPLLYQWSQEDSEVGLDAHGYFVQGSDASPGAIIDPIALSPADFDQVSQLGGVDTVLVRCPLARREESTHITVRRSGE